MRVQKGDYLGFKEAKIAGVNGGLRLLRVSAGNVLHAILQF